MSLPISVILKQIESVPESVLPILAALHNDKSILIDLTKSETKHLVSRTLNLARSPSEYSKWCGTNLIRVLVDNYTLLANEGVPIFGQLLKNLESYNETMDIKILNCTVDALNFTAQKIRGKPTLTRELLTPKLSSMITLFLEKLHYSPLLIIRSLRVLVQAHPTTFRPYGNKLRARLITLMNAPEFITYPVEIKEAIYETLAILPAIEKTDPEFVWASQVLNLVKETLSVLSIYNEFLNIGEDGDLVKLMRRLPKFEQDDSAKLLSALAIDLNDPSTILSVAGNLDILLNLIRVYVTTETNFGVRVPIGQIVILCEIICSINLKFLTFKYDVSEGTAQSLVKSTILSNQQNAIKLLSALASTYRGNMLPHLSNILSFLEILLPFKNKKFDYTELLAHEDFHSELLLCVESYLSLVSSLNDHSQLLKFVDVALLLVDPRFDQQQKPPGVSNKQIQYSGKRHNQKKKKSQASVPLSDLLSHQHLFIQDIPSRTAYAVRRFINAILTKVNLPPTQHYKIMRYIVIETVNAKHYNAEHRAPEELRELLVNAVLYPGFEQISLLPIVSSLIPRDPVLSVFNNPRFPPLSIYLKKTQDIEEEEEDDEDEDAEEEPQHKRRRFESSIGESSAAGDIDSMTDSVLEVTPLDETKLFTKPEFDGDSVLQFAPKETIIETVEEIKKLVSQEGETIQVETSTTTTSTVLTGEDDADFEMPEIDLGEESDDE